MIAKFDYKLYFIKLYWMFYRKLAILSYTEHVSHVNKNSRKCLLCMSLYSLYIVRCSFAHNNGYDCIQKDSLQLGEGCVLYSTISIYLDKYPLYYSIYIQQYISGCLATVYCLSYPYSAKIYSILVRNWRTSSWSIFVARVIPSDEDF